jgi:hypothetical protein
VPWPETAVHGGPRPGPRLRRAGANPQHNDMPALEITELDALTLLVMVDNESDILSRGLIGESTAFR